MAVFQVPSIETERDKLQAKIARASEAIYRVAKAAYGPKAGNVLLGFRHGAPLLSRDGVTNLKQVRLADPIEDDVVQAIHQVSEQNNRKVGDGTTAVVILTHHLLMAAQRMEAKGLNPMEIAAKLKEAERAALDYINELKVPLAENGEGVELQYVAEVAAGDKELGAMITDIMREVGADGGVIIEPYEGLGVHPTIFDGFYFGKGYKDTDLVNDLAENQSNHKDVAILVSNKTFETEVDIAPVLNKIVESGLKEVIIIGEVGPAALQVLKLARAKGLILTVPVDPPYVVGGRTLFLDDVALMVGANVYDGVDFNLEMLGHAEEVLINPWSTSIVGGDADPELLTQRLDALREQLKELDNPNDIQFCKDRIARLTGKMAIIKVGGAIEFEREETKLRVQDAVCAVQSAMKDGVLPGGGATLARISGTEFDDAFKMPFKTLVENAGLNPEAYLAKLELSDKWTGFNLRDISDQPVDMLKEGVLDVSLVVKEIVTNAIAVASGLITASASVSYREKE